MHIGKFVARWAASGAAERANKDAFLIDLCSVLGVATPDPVTGDPEKDLYVFEKDAVLVHEGKKSTVGKIDLYRHQKFVLEAKQGSDAGSKKHGTAKRGTSAWAIAMKDAYGQALQYARTLDEPPPFLIATDIGHCFDLYAVFDGSLDYRPFPNAQTNRIFLSDLGKHLNLFRGIWTDPHALDPSRVAARVTRDMAIQLATLAKSLEKSGHAPDAVATFLMRCLFTMFSEDVALLPDKLFQKALKEHWLPNPAGFPIGVETLWRAMNDGATFGFIGRLLRFNGGLFAQPSALPLNKEQLQLLLDAAECNWADVEPAIFGTLLERALDPKERHKLGAHFTPRAYVERIVKPTIEEPLRAEWDIARAEVRRLVGEEKDKLQQAKKSKSKKSGSEEKNLKEARHIVQEFHKKLCSTSVLDPACGSGNFLYVTLDLFKKLESEVLALLADLGDTQYRLDLQTVTVSPRQFFGIEIKRWAKEIAELVLWIGFLQHHYRTRRNADGKVQWPEPVLENLRNIECRDAVLEWDGEPEIVRDEKTGKPLTRWNGESYKKHPVTGEDVPDESARVVVYHYKNPRKAPWPSVDFIVGNPPFLGKLRFLSLFGDGYAAALREAYDNEVPDSADFVMYWWWRAAQAVRNGHAKRFGFITTNSIVQTFNRRIVADSLADGSLHLAFAVPDHPWVESSDGASVRIAMTVGVPGEATGVLLRVTDEEEKGGETSLKFGRTIGAIHPNLRVGAAVNAAVALRSNDRLASMGPMLGSRGFLVTRAERDGFIQKDGPVAAERIRPLRSGRDMATRPRGHFAIDLHGLELDEVRTRIPAVYQHVFNLVYPERSQNNDARLRARWWLFRRSNDLQRTMIAGLRRFIVTAETAKHRAFGFEPAQVLAEHGTITIGLDDAYFLGVLSSRIHVTWALAAGGRLGIGNDPRYNKTVCFDPFPFPDCNETHKAHIRKLGEALDAHRKKVQTQHSGLTITGMYNVLTRLRAGEALNNKEKDIHEKGLISVLKQIHDDLDVAVSAAYGWPTDLTDEQILEGVVVLNARRAEEERNGLIRWLRPDFQNPAGKPAIQLKIVSGEESETEAAWSATTASVPWPKRMVEQIAAVRDLVAKTTSSWTAKQVAAHYKGAKREDVEDILDSLAALGILIAYDERDGRRWQGIGRIAA